jgi:hypothetical protein
VIPNDIDSPLESKLSAHILGKTGLIRFSQNLVDSEEN